MNELLADIVRLQQLTSYRLIFIAILDFLGILICAWAYRVSRDIHRRTDELVNSSEKISFYLFGKVGPLEIDQ